MREAFLLPNIITLCNLLCGCIAVVLTFHGNLVGSAIFILTATVFDFLDGMAARALNMKTLIGKDLDSLADVISFGLAPSCIIYHLFYFSGTPVGPMLGGMPILPFIAFFLTAMAAVRLAVFNNDPIQSHDFRGLPTPAAGIFIASFPFLLMHKSYSLIGTNLSVLTGLLTNPIFLIPITIIISFLMISRIPLFSLKLSSKDWAKNKLRYIFLIISLVLIVISGFGALFFIIPLYILLSLLFYNPQTA